MTPHQAATCLAHWPAQLTTISASTSPSAVATPVTAFPAVRMPVTRVRSAMTAPPMRAPLASA